MLRTEDRNTIVLENAPLVGYVLGWSRIPNGHYDDCRQEGYLALIHAVDHYDPARDEALSTYAVRCIRGAILDYINRRIHRPTRGVRDTEKLYDAQKERIQERIERGKETAIPDRSDQDVIDDADAVANCLDKLRPRYRRVVDIHYGFDGTGAKTLSETGEVLGCSHEYVRVELERAYYSMSRKEGRPVA